MTGQKEPPSPYETLLLERSGACVQVTLNRPEKLNSLNRTLRGELAAVMGELAADDSVHAVILTGAGRAFCAGMDLKEFEQPPGQAGREAAHVSVFQAVEAMPQPVIAAINGFAITGGFELALACDILLASRSARFADTHAPLAIMPGAGLSQKLSRILGRPRAMALSLTGDFLSAEEAFQHGLVSHLLADDELLPFAQAMGRKISELDPTAARSIKKLIREGGKTTLAEGLALETSVQEDWARRGKGGLKASQREAVMGSTRRGLTQGGT